MKCGEMKKIGEICKLILPDIYIPLSFGNVEISDFFDFLKKKSKEEANYNVERGILEEIY